MKTKAIFDMRYILYALFKKPIIFQAALLKFCSQKVIFTVKTPKFVAQCVKRVELLFHDQKKSNLYIFAKFDENKYQRNTPDKMKNFDNLFLNKGLNQTCSLF